MSSTTARWSTDDIEAVLQAAGKRWEVVAEALKSGFPVDTILNGAEVTILYLAVHYQHLETVQLALSFGANPNFQHWSSSFSPVHVACISGCDTILRVLIEAGGDVNAVAVVPSVGAWSVLEVAINSRQSHWDSVLELLLAQPSLKLPPIAALHGLKAYPDARIMIANEVGE